MRTTKHIAPLLAAVSMLGLLSTPGLAEWTPKHTPDGQPDVQGFWLTVVYGMGCLTNPKGEVGCIDPPEGRAGGARNRPQPKAASRVIDIPDGEVPYQPWARERQQNLLKNYFEPTKPEFIDPQQLCWPLGPVRQLTWHDVQILQYPGYVILAHEGSHVYRVIPLDGHPHVGPDIKLWMGDSRGHWEGNTLVVDVTNHNAKGRLSRAGDFSSEKVHYVERFQFLDENRMKYEALFDDPSVYTRPWTFGFEMKRAIFGESNPTGDDAHYEAWEEACYEGMKDIDRSLRSSGEMKPDEISKRN
ncbi:MAG: hypothetical protein JO323_07655 [Acidobacteriia bacterium]|nr:hypothetical protein [Terriglobia bacterium]